MREFKRIFLLAGVTAVFPCVARADAGVPMLFLVMPAMGLSLVPIVLIEAAYFHYKIDMLPRSAGRASLVANLASTVAGVPITWIALVILQMTTGGGGAYGLDSLEARLAAVTWQAPWLIPYEDDLHWMIPAAGSVLLIPFFFVSWWIEYRIFLKMAPSIPAGLACRVVRNANLLTYALLLLWPIVFFIWK